MLIVLIIVVVFLLLFLLIAYGTYRAAFYNANKVPDDPHRIPAGPKYDLYREASLELIDQTLALPYEEVETRSRDGLKLSGKFYRTSPDRPVAILMHGWHGIAERDFAGGVQNHLGEGTNVLLVDERAHQKSEGHTITFGIRERYDCLDWIDYCLERFGRNTRILIHGVSMGGATVLMAAGLKELPSNVIGVISDSGYTNPKEIICKVVRQKGFDPRYVYPFMRAGAILFGHFDPNEGSALEAMKENRIPALFIHGTGDDFVPYEMGKALYEASKGPKYMVTSPGAAHVMAYMYDQELYMKVFRQFCAAVFDEADEGEMPVL